MDPIQPARAKTERERALLQALLHIRSTLLAAEHRARELIASRSAADAESTRNFLHYHALRAHDIRPLQDALARSGLSSLGRCEAHVLATLDAVIDVLRRLTDGEATAIEPSVGAPSFDSGRERLEERAGRLLGPPPSRGVRIMVTLSNEDAEEPDRVRALIEQGMDLARINCAHDDANVWAALAGHVHTASAAVGKPCRIEMDLGGPKLRTGPARGDIILRPGDRLRLLRDPCEGEPARLDDHGELVFPSISCSLAEALDHVAVSQPIWFDDGKIGAVVRAVYADGVELEITHASRSGRALREDKGINLPETELRLPALTASDHTLLPFVARHADIVGLSFVQSPEDVCALDDELTHLGSSCGMVIKIETKRAFSALPGILIQALGGRPTGVMIARGDLAVEVGFERLAEVQEEMLWLCEAAHLPVIWATQVLDRLARKGTPTRAEITDAAMSERAECVMLNKGAHVIEAVRVLGDVLSRMTAHQYKKTPALRPLSLARESATPPSSAHSRPIHPRLRG
jgi:pyruvate kinase